MAKQRMYYDIAKATAILGLTPAPVTRALSDAVTWFQEHGYLSTHVSGDIMAIALKQAIAVGSYVVRQRLMGKKRYPLVLMLEPLFRCNLACSGCGKIQHPVEILRQHLSPEKCFEAVDECGAPGRRDSRRRAAAASADRRDRRRPDRAQEVRLPVHQRAAPGSEPR